jgi:HSP20 family protein
MAISSLVHRDPFFPFHRPLGLRSSQPESRFMPNIDAVENETEYRVSAELPGLEESDFKVKIEDGVLTLEGEKKSRHESNEKRHGYRRVESRWGHFVRRLRFGAEVDPDGVNASYKNGLLEVVVPKVLQEDKVRTIPVTSA